MQTDPMNDERFKARRLDFLIADYWQKISYLKDHFTRLWNRFNYFLTIQSALFGATVLSPGKYRWWVPIFAALVCCLWYIFGAQDRYLVDLYRKEIEHALDQIRPSLGLTNYYSVGQTEDTANQAERITDLGVKSGFYQWRWQSLSTTKLPALFPVILLMIWLVILLILLSRG